MDLYAIADGWIEDAALRRARTRIVMVISAGGMVGLLPRE